jgi:hypothetical protein
VAAGIVIAIALALLGIDALLYAQEPARSVRVAALAGGVGGFLAAFVVALLATESALVAFAIALLGAAVLALVLLGQMRLVRAITRTT